MTRGVSAHRGADVDPASTSPAARRSVNGRAGHVSVETGASASARRRRRRRSLNQPGVASNDKRRRPTRTLRAAIRPKLGPAATKPQAVTQPHRPGHGLRGVAARRLRHAVDQPADQPSQSERRLPLRGTRLTSSEQKWCSNLVRRLFRRRAPRPSPYGVLEFAPHRGRRPDRPDGAPARCGGHHHRRRRQLHCAGLRPVAAKAVRRVRAAFPATMRGEIISRVISPAHWGTLGRVATGRSESPPGCTTRSCSTAPPSAT